MRGRFAIPWRLVSGLLVLRLLMVLALFFTRMPSTFTVSPLAGCSYMSSNEIFTLTNVTNMHIFWVDPEQVRADILRSPTVADAQVRVGWPPNMVQIIITEREPALVWEQAGTANWIDLQGRVMRQREDRPDLLRVLGRCLSQWAGWRDDRSGYCDRGGAVTIAAARRQRFTLPP